MAFEFEHTDTFGGEANYCWVRRQRFDLPPPPDAGQTPADIKRDRRRLVRAAKAFAGFTGMRCSTEDYGDMIRIDASPAGLCQVVFVNWID